MPDTFLYLEGTALPVPRNHMLLSLCWIRWRVRGSCSWRDGGRVMNASMCSLDEKLRVEWMEALIALALAMVVVRVGDLTSASLKNISTSLSIEAMVG